MKKIEKKYCNYYKRLMWAGAVLCSRVSGYIRTHVWEFRETNNLLSDLTWIQNSSRMGRIRPDEVSIGTTIIYNITSPGHGFVRITIQV